MYRGLYVYNRHINSSGRTDRVEEDDSFNPKLKAREKMEEETAEFYPKLNRRKEEKEKEEVFCPQLHKRRKREDEDRITVEFSALGRTFRFRLEPVPLPLSINSSFLLRR